MADWGCVCVVSDLRVGNFTTWCTVTVIRRPYVVLDAATDWPSRGSQPINEFNREGYITQAFTTLFPSGVVEYLAPRLIAVTAPNISNIYLSSEMAVFRSHASSFSRTTPSHPCRCCNWVAPT